MLRERTPLLFHRPVAVCTVSSTVLWTIGASHARTLAGAGLSIEQLTDVSERNRFRKAIILNSLLFIAGFSTVFVAFGASASLLGQALITYQEHLRRFGGIVVIIFGLYLMGILNLNFLKMEHRYQFRNRPAGFLGSFLIGMAAGLAGDRTSLGFLAETEKQVAEHLDGHLQKLPAGDHASRTSAARAVHWRASSGLPAAASFAIGTR